MKKDKEFFFELRLVSADCVKFVRNTVRDGWVVESTAYDPAVIIDNGLFPRYVSKHKFKVLRKSVPPCVVESSKWKKDRDFFEFTCSLTGMCICTHHIVRDGVVVDTREIRDFAYAIEKGILPRYVSKHNFKTQQ